MISYGGLAIHAPSGGEIEYARFAIDPARVWREFAPRLWPGPHLAGLPFRAWLDRPIELGVLDWPTGASRFAAYHGVVDSVQLDKIRNLVFVGSTINPQTLVLNDGLHSVSASMAMLPPRPLAIIPGAVQKWMLTLVDERYFWWFKSAAITVSSTWTSLFSAIGTALGVTLTVDTVPTAYLNPPFQLTQLYEHLPVLLDACAASVGMRVVRKYDGTVLVQNATNGLAQAAANFTQTPPWPLRAGGKFADADLKAALPASVTVAFGGKQDYTANATLYAKNVTGSGVAAAVRPIHSTAEANYTGGVGTPTNQSELDALATQISSDWYAFHSQRWDVVYHGPCPWVPESVSDLIEFVHTDSDISVRIQGGSFDDWPAVLYHKSSNTEGNAVLTLTRGATLVPVGGYFGATGSSGDGTIGTKGDSSPGGAWAVKDGLIIHAGTLTINDSSTGLAPGVSSITFTSAGNVTPTVTTDNLGHASVKFNGATGSGSITFNGARFPSCEAHTYASGGTNGNCTWSLADGTFAKTNYDPVPYLNAGNKTQVILPLTGFYDIKVTTIWNAVGASGGATGYDVNQTINTSASGGLPLVTNEFKTTLPTTADDQNVAIITTTDFQGTAGDTITVNVQNDNNLSTASLLEGCLTIHYLGS